MTTLNLSNQEIELWEWRKMRCYGFDDNNIREFESSEYWFKRSAELDYPPAIAYFLSSLKSVPDSKYFRDGLLYLIQSRHPEALNSLSYISSNKEAKLAWLLLACDFGYDCNGDSKELWRLSVFVHCQLEEYKGNPCNNSMTYSELLLSGKSDELVNRVVTKKAKLKTAILNSTISEFSIDELLH